MIAVTSDDDVTVRADRTLLHLALVNLVHNAIQHGPADSKILITAARRARKIDISSEGPRARNTARISRENFSSDFSASIKRDRARQGGAPALVFASPNKRSSVLAVELFLESNSDRGSVFRIEFET